MRLIHITQKNYELLSTAEQQQQFCVLAHEICLP